MKIFILFFVIGLSHVFADSNSDGLCVLCRNSVILLKEATSEELENVIPTEKFCSNVEIDKLEECFNVISQIQQLSELVAAGAGDENSICAAAKLCTSDNVEEPVQGLESESNDIMEENENIVGETKENDGVEIVGSPRHRYTHTIVPFNPHDPYYHHPSPYNPHHLPYPPHHHIPPYNPHHPYYPPTPPYNPHIPPNCSVCLGLANSVVHTGVHNTQTTQRLLLHNCSRFPPGQSTICHNFVSRYGYQMAGLLVSHYNSHDICLQLHACLQ